MPEKEKAPSPAASLVLDIGPGAGALLVDAPSDLEGYELHITERNNGYRTHAIVRRWDTGGIIRFAALYPELPPGSYSILGSEETAVAEAEIKEGQVATADVIAGWQ